MTASSKINPDSREVEKLLVRAVQLHKADRIREAESLYWDVLDRDPDNVRALHHLGVIARREGQPERAVELMERSREKAPRDVALCNNLSRAYLDAGQSENAVAIMREAVAIAPDKSNLWNQLSLALRQRRELGEALEASRRAVESAPDDMNVRLGLGSVYHAMGRFEDARAVYQEVVDRAPQMPQAHQNMGTLYKMLGETEEARRSYRRALQINPRMTGAWRAVCDLRKLKPGDPEITEMERLYASTDLTDDERMQLFFALGKAYEDTRQDDRAFWCFQHGNKIKSRQIGFKLQEHLKDFRTIRQTFNADLMHRMTGSGCPDPTPIFILGMPRSGTTLAEQILSSHSEVVGGGELYELSRIVVQAKTLVGVEGRYPGWVPQLDSAALRRLGREYIDAVRRAHPDAKYVVDKMPANFRYLGLIRLILPNAKIIHTRRHPIDTCVSCFTKLFNEGQGFSYNLNTLGRFYRAYEELMAHWRAILPETDILDLQYERLIDDFEAQTRRILDYCGLDWEDAVRRFHENQRGVATASVMQVRQPLYKSSVQRWRRYEKHLDPLFNAMAQSLRETGPE